MKKPVFSSRRDFCKQSMLCFGSSLIIYAPFTEMVGSLNLIRNDVEVRYVRVADADGRYFGWPANNGMWKWEDGKEILVGFTDGPFDTKGGFHRIGKPRRSKLARSRDGGETWAVENPDNFVGSPGFYTIFQGKINFGHKDFAMRISSAGYHGNDDTFGHFYFSYDRGITWQGGFRFGGLQNIYELKGMEITSRTNYLILDENTIRIFMTARNPDVVHSDRRDKTFVLESRDGGQSFQFISWVVPWGERDFRAAMPSGVRTRDGKMVVAVRVKNPYDSDVPCWIDGYVSEDHGRSWNYQGMIGETGFDNGNPPALTVLKDNRLVCCYANRDRNQLVVRYSKDDGRSWSDETIIRDNRYSNDMGYPQLLQNNRGELVALYYIATEEHPNNYIEAAIWRP